MFMKEAAERTHALEPHLKTDFGDGKIAFAQQLLGALDAALGEILMRRLVEGFPKQPQEMIAGKIGLSGNLPEIERALERLVDELAGAVNPPVNLRFFSTSLSGYVKVWDHG